MSLKALNLETLAILNDGKVHEAFAQHLKRAALDCYDRPGDPTPRKVSLDFLLVPVVSSDRDVTCEEVKARCQVHSAIPKHRTKIMSLGLKPTGMLIFNNDSLDSVDQTTFLRDEDEDAA